MNVKLIGGFLVVALVGGAAFALTSGGSDDPPAPQASPTESEPTASPEPSPEEPDEPEPPGPSIPTAALSDMAKAIGKVLTRDSCRATSAFVHQTGRKPLKDKSLSPAFVCATVADKGTRVRGGPRLKKPSLVVATLASEPLAEATSDITYQPGLGLDRPGMKDRKPEGEGEGILRVPADLLAFAQQAGWHPSIVFDPRDFTPATVDISSFFEPGSRFQAFIVPVDEVTPDTAVYLQSFGRSTPKGESPTLDDPAASHLVQVGPLGGCITSGGDCWPGLGEGRFEVEVEWAKGTAVGEEAHSGAFWFFGANNLEIMIKVLDNCNFNDRFWVFAGGLTDVEVNITITDTLSGETKTFDTDGSDPVLDTNAFATCP